ncbi:MAG TPA: RNA polymerase sigma factor, partial [Saprospiraceae bacterium]|nr:RNA polymerase sigma factor [Saprospiraceae bacterium]
MKEHQWADEALISAITGTSESREKALQYVFHQTEWKEVVLRFVQQYGGNEQDGEDIFQETIILFDRNLRQAKFEGKSALKTYFMAIAKRRWWKQAGKRRPQEELTPQHYEAAEPSVECQVISEEQASYLAQAMEQAGSRCKEILKLYQLDYSMEEIARAVALSSAAMAKKEAYRCRQRLRQFLENNPHWK